MTEKQLERYLLLDKKIKETTEYDEKTRIELKQLEKEIKYKRIK